MLSQSRLKEALNYDDITGEFTWKIAISNRIKIGTRAGYAGRVKTKTKYRSLRLDGKLYLEHRLVWLYIYGVFPSNYLDHKDGNGLNNAVSNLRLASKPINSKNKPTPSNNTSGHIGVIKRSNTHWIAQIGLGTTVYLGSFKTRDEAIAARKAAEIKHGFHQNHGRTLINR